MANNRKHKELESIVKDEFDFPEENENEIVFVEDKVDVLETTVEEINEITELLDEIDKQAFVDVAKLYDRGDLGHVVMNLETREKRFMPSNNIYYIAKIKRFSMPLAEFNNLENL